MLFASTAPAASTGCLTDSPPRTLRDPRPVADRSGTGRPRGATDDRHRATRGRGPRRRGAAGRRWRRRRGRARGRRLRRFRSSASRDRDTESPAGRRRLHRPARCCAPAAGRLCRSSCKQPIVVAHDPVVRDRAVSSSRKTVSSRSPRGTRHVKVVRRRRRLRKPPIVVGPVLRLEKRIRRLDVGDAFPAELLHQAILMRPVIALDPPLGLRRARRDDLDPQRRAHAAKLRQRLGARHALLLIRRAAHTHSSNRCRAPAESRTARSRPAGRRPPPRSFPARRTGPALRPVASSTSVSKQLCGPAIFEPRMKAAVQLHQLAEVRLALPAPPMRTALPRATPQPRRQHPPPQRFVIDRQPVFTRQMLGRQRRPKSLVDRRRCISPGSAPAPASAAAAASPDSTRARRSDVSAPPRPASRYRRYNRFACR